MIVVTQPASYDTDVFNVDNRTAVTVGSTVLLECAGERSGLGSFSAPSVVWIRNGEQVVADGRITQSTSSGGRRRTSDLTITNFGLSDAGVYQCIFTSDTEVITTIPLRLDTGWSRLSKSTIRSPPHPHHQLLFCKKQNWRKRPGNTFSQGDVSDFDQTSRIIIYSQGGGEVGYVADCIQMCNACSYILFIHSG